MLSLILAEKILSLFVMMAMGFALVKAGFVKSQDSRAIAMLNLYVINPCMIISSFQVDMTQEVRLGFLVAIIGAVATQGLFLVLTTVFKKPLKLDEVEQTLKKQDFVRCHQSFLINAAKISSLSPNSAVGRSEAFSSFSTARSSSES